jgi:uncharacterized protein (DUF58 family)
MNRPLLVSALAFAFLLAGLALRQSGLLLLALPLALYLLAGLWKMPEDVNLKITRKTSAWRIALGESIQVTLNITNNGPALEELLVEDLLPNRLEVVEGSNRRLLNLPAGGTETWTYTLTGKRGYYMLHRVAATARDHLGLVSVSRLFATDGQLFVVPPVLRLRRISIRPRRTRIFSGSIPARQGGPGLDFFDVREYQTGDSSRSINWQLSARHDGLYTNQYEQERVVDVGIILDGRRNTNEIGERSIFEYSVMAAAALSNAFLSAGNRVGMLSYGKQIRWTMPGYGKIQGEKILHDLSEQEPGDSHALSELHIPHRRFPFGSQLVFISPLTADDFNALAGLRSQGYAVLVVSPDTVAFEAQSESPSENLSLALRVIRLRREVFLGRLRSIGVHVVNWDVSQPFEQVARRELERRFLAQGNRR